MVNYDERIGFFIDFENLFIGVKKDYKTRPFVKRLEEFGTISVKKAYGDWFVYNKHRIDLVQNGFDLIEQPKITIREKNAADIKLVIDCLDYAYRFPEISTYAIASGDTDFLPLIMKLREHGKKVIVIASKKATNRIMQENCDQFIASETVIGTQTVIEADIDKPINLFKRVLRIIEGSGEILYLSRVKARMLKLDPSFDEKLYGYSGFKDFTEFLMREANLPYELEREKDGGWVIQPVQEIVHDTQFNKIIPIFEKAISIREGKDKILDIGQQKNLMQDLDPSFDESNYGYKKFINFLVDFLDHTNLPYHVEKRADNMTWIISTGAHDAKDRQRSIKMEVHDDDLLSSFSKKSISKEEWKIVIDAVERCLKDGEGKYFKGKQWIITAYLHTMRTENKLSFNPKYDRAVLLILRDNNILDQVKNDVFYLSNNYTRAKREFVRDL